MQVWLTHYCNEEEANGKMFRQIGDISPSKFIHSSPRKITCIIIYKKKYLYQEKKKKRGRNIAYLHHKSPSKPQYDSLAANFPPSRSDRNIDSNSPTCFPILQYADKFFQKKK